MTRPTFTPTEIAAAAKEARANGVVIELHKPDGSRIIMRSMDVLINYEHGAPVEGNSCDKAFGP